MRNFLLLTMIAAAVPMAAQVAQKASRPVSAVAAPRPVAKPVSSNGLPSGAEQVDQFTWRAKDDKGVVWLYRKNPFGFSKVREDEANKPVAPLAAPMDVRVKEDSDGKLRFERTGPWGVQKWSKTRAELTDEEKLWVAKGQEAAKK